MEFVSGTPAKGIIDSYQSPLVFQTLRSDRMTIATNGNVGIGTATPATSLDVGGGIQISGVSGSTPSPGVSYGLFPYGGIGLGIVSGATGPTQGIGIWTNPGGQVTEVMRILSGGNVGIGTINPQYKLDVYGTIHAHQVNVDLTGTPDYVFDKDYHMPTLSETAAYIDKNHHLSEIPSAAEITKNGLNLGEMNKLLLKKVEELTLYLIEKDKAEKEQEILNQKQQNQIDLLIKQVAELSKTKNQ